MIDRNFVGRFLSEQEKLTEQRLHELKLILENELRCPDHIVDTLHQLRQNAEDDLSNILHLQSIYPGRSANSGSVKSPRRVQMMTRPGVDLGDVDEEAGVETGEVVLADDDMFALDGVAAVTAPLSEEEREEHDSEADEGIHIPSKYRHRNVKPLEVECIDAISTFQFSNCPGCCLLASWHSLASSNDSWSSWRQTAAETADR